MKPKRLVSRELAKLDIEAAFDHYLVEAGPDIAIAFVDEIERAFNRISRNAAAGSPRYAHELDLSELRFRTVKRFPYLIFYVDFGSHVDVWRVLHSHSDIPSWLDDPDSAP
ncbi:MAG: type II toxin-antitoxin system RelE/ParE family toxin [Pyrinomonadaceae bacterium]